MTPTQERKGLYRVTFADPLHEEWGRCQCGAKHTADHNYCHGCGVPKGGGGSKLDVSHGAGYHDDPRPLAISSTEPYVGPLSDDELAFLKSISDGSAAKSLSYNPTWNVTVQEVQAS